MAGDGSIKALAVRLVVLVAILGLICLVARGKAEVGVGVRQAVSHRMSFARVPMRLNTRIGCSAVDLGNSNGGVASESGVVSAERIEFLRKRFTKKFGPGPEGVEKHWDKIMEMEKKLSSYEEKERNRRIGISLANAGKKPWNTGKKHSEETREKIRQRTAAAMKRPNILSKLRSTNLTRSSRTVAKPKKVRARVAKPRKPAAPRKRKPAKEDPAVIAEKERMMKRREEALERLSEGRGRVSIRKVADFDNWTPLSGSASNSHKNRVLEGVTARLFENSISQQQLDDLEVVVKHLELAKKADVELTELKEQLTELQNDPEMGAGERSLLKAHFQNANAIYTEATKSVRAIYSRLPDLEQLQDAVGDWIDLHQLQQVHVEPETIVEHEQYLVEQPIIKGAPVFERVITVEEENLDDDMMNNIDDVMSRIEESLKDIERDIERLTSPERRLAAPVKKSNPLLVVVPSVKKQLVAL